MKALILGNGESRKGFDYRKEYPNAFVYGCNGAYKEEPDALIVTDIAMQQIVYDTGYCKNHVCYFSQWNPIPGDLVENLIESLDKPISQTSRGNRDLAVVNGDEKNTYITWIDDEDEVVSVEDVSISSGSRALLIACEDGRFDEIILIGFDGMGARNYYQDDPGYENSTPRDIWIKERMIIKGLHSHIKFHEINTL